MFGRKEASRTGMHKLLLRHTPHPTQRKEQGATAQKSGIHSSGQTPKYHRRVFCAAKALSLDPTTLPPKTALALAHPPQYAEMLPQDVGKTGSFAPPLAVQLGWCCVRDFVRTAEHGGASDGSKCTPVHGGFHSGGGNENASTRRLLFAALIPRVFSCTGPVQTANIFC